MKKLNIERGGRFSGIKRRGLINGMTLYRRREVNCTTGISIV